MQEHAQHDTARRPGEPQTLPEPLQTLLQEAAAQGATDVHLDPIPDGVLIRFRVDGMLHTKETVPAEQGRRLQNQVRVAAGLDTETVFVPVEARMHWREPAGERTIRVVIVPTAGAEATHLRILYPPERLRDIRALGLPADQLEQVLGVLKTYSGLVLVGGQTGTGKTTTLYALAPASTPSTAPTRPWPARA